MNNWFKRLYSKCLQLANTKWGILVLFLCAFADASFLPLPVTTFFLILILLNTRMVFKYSFFVILGTLAGSLAGYAVGHFVWLKPDGEFTGVVQFLFKNIPGFSAGAYEKVHSLYTKWDYWILCVAAITPVPYGVFSISSGVFEINVFIFLFTTLITQTIKFTFLALVTTKLGSEVKKLMEFNWKPVAIITSVSVFIAFLVIRII